MLGLFPPLYVYFILLLLIVSCGIDIIVVSRGIDTCNRCILCPSLNVSCVFPFVQRSDRVASGGVRYVLGPAT